MQCGSPCHRDATVMFARMELNPKNVEGVTLESLGAHELDTMAGWVRVAAFHVRGCRPVTLLLGCCAQQERLEFKYKIVGFLNDGCKPRSVASEAAAEAAKKLPPVNKTD